MASFSPSSTAGQASSDFSFQVETSSNSNGGEDGPRLGRMSFLGRGKISTPHYVAIASRGTVPHLSQDMMRSHTGISGLYTALEDYIEKASFHQEPPIYSCPCPLADSPLRRFIALQKDALLVLGARRLPTLPCPTPNSNSSLSIVTSVGFSSLDANDYVAAVQKLRPDVVVGLADLVTDVETASKKRMEKMSDRTQTWLRALVEGLRGVQQQPQIKRTAIFAPILPIEQEQQSYYLEAMCEDYHEDIAGLVVYSSSSVLSIPASMKTLPRLGMCEPKKPHEILRDIALGVDCHTIPFVNALSDAGIALTFKFPAPTHDEIWSSQISHFTEHLSSISVPLGINLWDSTNATSLSPLKNQCACYTCTHHHRAYVNHLLSAKEMLAWVLLQVHNHHIIDLFFNEIRKSIADNSFEHERLRFMNVYDENFPQKTGEGPRVRGYQVRSKGGGEPKKNALAFRTLGAMKNERKQAQERQLRAKDGGLRMNEKAEKLAESMEDMVVGISAEDFEVKNLGEKTVEGSS